MFISFAAYPRELKQLIKVLKSENLFQDEPLRRLEMHILIWLSVMLCPFYAFWLLSDVQLQAGEILFYHALVLSGAVWIVRETAQHLILPYSCGHIEKGVVLTDATYQIAKVYGGLAWCFDYEVLGTDTPKLARVYPKAAMPDPPYRKGQVIAVLLHPSNLKISTPYFPMLAWRFCIDKRLVEEVSKGSILGVSE